MAEFVEWVAYFTLQNETPEERMAAKTKDPIQFAKLIRAAMS